MMSKYTDEKDAVCGVCESIFGNFHDNFITINNKGGEEVSKMLKYALEDKKIDVDNIDKYLYITELCGGSAIIKR